MLVANNYTRGNIYRDKKSIEMALSGHFPENQEIFGSEAFIVAVSKEEDEKGLILADLVYFGISGNEIFCFGIDDFIMKVPLDKFEVFTFKEFENINYHFPPQIPPKRAGLFNIVWKNSDSMRRKLTIMFPSPAIFEFELEYPSQLVHRKIMEANSAKNFYTSEVTEELRYFLQYLPTVGIPNEVNTEECSLTEKLGYF